MSRFEQLAIPWTKFGWHRFRQKGLSLEFNDMKLPAKIGLDVTIRLRRFTTELEFIGEPNEVPAEIIAGRITAVRMEIEDAVRSNRTLLALARVNRLG